MARPYSSNPTDNLGYNPDDTKEILHARAKNTGQLHALIAHLQQLCRVVHPEGDNLKAFGHEIRNLIILAATETEAYLKRILEANGAEGERTSDYVKLCEPLKLPKFAVDFPWYPWMDPIRPFEGWSNSAPTRTLSWYAAYNDVKHDRERKFSEATLLNAFRGISGCFVLLCAQHGWDFARRDTNARNEFLRLAEAPTWGPGHVYVPPFNSGKWIAKPHPSLA